MIKRALVTAAFITLAAVTGAQAIQPTPTPIPGPTPPPGVLPPITTRDHQVYLPIVKGATTWQEQR